MASPLLSLRDISKRFGPTLALDRVCLSVESGQVLALIGENGAGKSTLLKVLSGAHPADSGKIDLLGKPYLPSGDPLQARTAGIATIYQELNLAPDLSVEDNMLLGLPCLPGGLLLRNRQRARVQQALDTVGLTNLSPKAIVGQLSVANQQLIEIARALVSNAKIILFDEPTSSLPRAEVERLFGIVKHLKSLGMGIIYISHFLEEIRLIADRYCVLRDGRHVGAGAVADVSDSEIISLMVGRDVRELYPAVDHVPGSVALSTSNLFGPRYPQRIDLELREGEIFGVAGLVGAGRTELVRLLMALEHQKNGQVQVSGRPIASRIAARMKAGLGLLSEDRKREGLAQGLSIVENITLSNLRKYAKSGFLQLGKRERIANQLMQQLEVKAHCATQLVAELSGGNQQKVALARILHQESKILLLDEPTKGIDVGTKSEIYRLMGQLAAEGRTIVFVSSYLPELLAVCDRIGVMARGRMVEIRDAKDWTDEQIMMCAVSSQPISVDNARSEG